MLDVETGLLKQKEEFAMKMESLTQRREELARKETQLKDSLLKFDKFLQVYNYPLDIKRRKTMPRDCEQSRSPSRREKLRIPKNWKYMTSKTIFQG